MAWVVNSCVAAYIVFFYVLLKILPSPLLTAPPVILIDIHISLGRLHAVGEFFVKN